MIKGYTVVYVSLGRTSMCGRFPQSGKLSRYERALEEGGGWSQTPRDLPIRLAPTWNMAPSRDVLAFHDAAAGHVAELLRWGFLPYWADANARRPINARVETAAKIPYFRNAWRRGRCVIPADGWYEWKVTPAGKVPHFIYRSDHEPALIAGLFETNRPANVTTFAILTTEAIGALREIHDREPVVLSPENALRWINLHTPLKEVSEIAQQPLASDCFTWHVVSTRVNDPKHDGEDLMAPAV